MPTNPAHAASPCSIAPWLTVRSGSQAVEFYKSAFGAMEVYRFEDPSGGLVAKLSVHGAEFWVSGGPAVEPGDSSPESVGASPESVGGGTVRMIFTVADPDSVFAHALSVGASEIFPVGEAHGWRLGRLADPFGLHWEIGRQL